MKSPVSKRARADLRLHALGFVFQAYNLVPVLTARENVEFVLELQGAGSERSERARDILAHTPMDRFGEPDDLIGTALWLVSDGSSFVNGAVIPVDGGFSAFSGV